MLKKILGAAMALTAALVMASAHGQEKKKKKHKKNWEQWEAEP